MEVLEAVCFGFDANVLMVLLPGMITGGSAAAGASSTRRLAEARCSSCSSVSSSLSISAFSLTEKCGLDIHSGKMRCNVSGFRSE
jgi:hypothetical protein